MLKRFKTFKVLDRLSLKPLLSYSSKHFPLIRLSDLTSIGITANLLEIRKSASALFRCKVK